MPYNCASIWLAARRSLVAGPETYSAPAHFDPPTNEKLLRKVHDALADGGRAVTLEFVPNEDRISPPPAAMFSMVMLASTPKGDAYTFAEFESMFKNAGFRKSEFHPLPENPEQVIVSYA